MHIRLYGPHIYAENLSSIVQNPDANRQICKSIQEFFNVFKWIINKPPNWMSLPVLGGSHFFGENL